MKPIPSLLVLAPLTIGCAAWAIATPSGSTVSDQELRKWTGRTFNSVHAIEVQTAIDERLLGPAWVRFAPLSPASILSLQASVAPSSLQCTPLPVTSAEVEVDLLQDGLPARVYTATVPSGQSQALVAVPPPNGGWLGQPMKIARRAYSNGLLVFEDEVVASFR
jgi:hypothetical protein